ncbi:MAG: hypothetical protein FWF18_04670 [Dehalococcoidia bacterium]|nr:hypothetical protein [Dehalococcoidia bacterium]
MFIRIFASALSNSGRLHAAEDTAIIRRREGAKRPKPSAIKRLASGITCLDKIAIHDHLDFWYMTTRKQSEDFLHQV